MRKTRIHLACYLLILLVPGCTNTLTIPILPLDYYLVPAPTNTTPQFDDTFPTNSASRPKL